MVPLPMLARAVSFYFFSLYLLTATVVIVRAFL